MTGAGGVWAAAAAASGVEICCSLDSGRLNDSPADLDGKYSFDDGDLFDDDDDGDDNGDGAVVAAAIGGADSGADC